MLSPLKFERKYFLFSEWEYYPAQKLLISPKLKRSHQLPQQLHRLLVLLLESRGDVATREAIINEIWGGNYLVGDAGLNRNVSTLRTLLDDNSQSYIKTIKRVGYAFNCEVVQKRQGTGWDILSTKASPLYLYRRVSLIVLIGALLTFSSILIPRILLDVSPPDQKPTFNQIFTDIEKIPDTDGLQRFPKFSHDGNELSYTTRTETGKTFPSVFNISDKSIRRYAGIHSDKAILTNDNSRMIVLTAAQPGTCTVQEQNLADLTSRFLENCDDFLTYADTHFYSLDVNHKNDALFVYSDPNSTNPKSGIALQRSGLNTEVITESERYPDSNPIWIDENKFAYVMTKNLDELSDIYTFDLVEKQKHRITELKKWIWSYTYDKKNDLMLSVHSKNGLKIVLLTFLSEEKQLIIDDVPYDIIDVDMHDENVFFTANLKHSTIERVPGGRNSSAFNYGTTHTLHEFGVHNNRIYSVSVNKGKLIYSAYNVQSTLEKKIPITAENISVLNFSNDGSRLFYIDDNAALFDYELSSEASYKMELNFGPLFYVEKSRCFNGYYVVENDNTGSGILWKVTSNGSYEKLLEQVGKVAETSDCTKLIYYDDRHYQISALLDSGETVPIMALDRNDQENWTIDEHLLISVRRIHSNDDIVSVNLENYQMQVLHSLESGTVAGWCCLGTDSNGNVYFKRDIVNETDIFSARINAELLIKNMK